MATLTANLTGYNGTASCTVTYSYTNTNETTVTLSITNIVYTHTTDVDLRVQVGITNSTVYWYYSFTDTTTGNKTSTNTFLRGTTASNQPLKIVINEVTDGVNTGKTVTKSVNIPVPARPSYTITYNANGHGTAPASQTKYYGFDERIAAAISATGYTFYRWNTASNNTGTAYSGDGWAKYTDNTNVTLYAIWNRTVTYNANGGSGAPGSQTSIDTTAITLSSTKPVRSGYMFISWNTKADGTGTNYSPGASYGTNKPSITLYAQWQKEITAIAIGSIKAIRTDDNTVSEPVETDEGTYAYIKIPFTVTGAAAGTATITATGVGDDGTILTVTTSPASINKSVDATLDSNFIVKASDCSTDMRYTFSITIICTNTTYSSQTAKTISRSIILPTAFFTVDFLAGGKGVHFGGAATDEGFWVSMPTYFRDSVTHLGSISMRINAAAVTSNTPIGSIITKDINGESVFYSQTVRETNNRTYTSFVHRRFSADGLSSISNGFYLRIANDNSLLVSFTSTDARDAWATGLNVVKKAGDTMSGILYLKATNTTSNVKPDTSAWGDSSIVYQDSAGTEVARLAIYYSSANANGQGLYIRTRRMIGSTEVLNQIGMSIDKDGNRSISFTDPVPWRVALALGENFSLLVTDSSGSSSSKSFSHTLISSSMYVVIVDKVNTTSANYAGLYIIGAHDQGGHVKAVVSSSYVTISISVNTLSITLSATYMRAAIYRLL